MGIGRRGDHGRHLGSCRDPHWLPLSSTCGGIGTHHPTFGDAITFPAIDATSSTLWKRTLTDDLFGPFVSVPGVGSA